MPTHVRRPVIQTALAALAILLLAAAYGVLAAPAHAATAYTGGPIVADAPLYVANDHSVYAVRFSASGLLDKDGLPLATTGTYYVKIRVSPTATPGGSTSRGFTWNPTTQSWIQERDAWTAFPTIATASDGTITTSPWFYFKFADTTKSGTWYLVVSLQPIDGGSGTSQNGNVAPAVTVMDMSGTLSSATYGFTVHNGVATGQTGGKRAEADASGLSDVWSLTRTEPNGVDGDGDGADLEDYGPAGAAGDFSLAVPTALAFDAKLQSTIWPAGAASVTGMLPDVDIALGAADQTAPTAPSSLAAAPGNGHTVLSWTAATDASGVAYNVYRWQDAPPIGGVTQYTPQPRLVATTADTTYDATGLNNGETYYFMVRAVDPSTNVGPRSETVTFVPDGTPPSPVTGFQATAGDASVDLSWTNPADADFDETVVVRNAGDHTATDPADGDVVYTGSGTSATDATAANGTLYTYTAFAEDTAGNTAAAATATATPQGTSVLTLGVAQPIVAFMGATTLTGTLADGHAVPLAGRTVTLQRSVAGGPWSDVRIFDSGTGSFQVTTPSLTVKTEFRLLWDGDAAHSLGVSLPVTVTPRVALGRPVAPSAVRAGRWFTVYGSLKPVHPAGAKTVKLRCYRKTSTGKWRLVATVPTVNVDYAGYSRYKVKLRIAKKGAWRLQAYAPADADHAAKSSAYEYFKVR